MVGDYQNSQQEPNCCSHFVDIRSSILAFSASSYTCKKSSSTAHIIPDRVVDAVCITPEEKVPSPPPPSSLRGVPGTVVVEPGWNRAALKNSYVVGKDITHWAGSVGAAEAAAAAAEAGRDVVLAQ